MVPDAPAAQAHRVFIARTNGSAFQGPTRHEYVTGFRRRPECDGIFPNSREHPSDSRVRLEYDGTHSGLLWDWQGKLAFSKDGVHRSTNIVKNVCNATQSGPPLPSQYNPG